MCPVAVCSAALSIASNARLNPRPPSSTAARASRLLDVLVRGDLPQERLESQLSREDLAAAVKKAKALLTF